LFAVCWLEAYNLCQSNKGGSVTIKRLTDTLVPEVSTKQHNAVARIDAEDYSAVLSLARRELAKQGLHPTDERMADAIYALKQYYSLTLLDRGHLHAIADSRYKGLCCDIGGFMHHDPLDRSDPEKVAAVAEVYHYTRDILVRLYGEHNLHIDFHPSVVTESSFVCLHDVDGPVAAARDGFSFEPNARNLYWRGRYGHEASRLQAQQFLA
jgi:hypothetical protein